MDYSNGNLISKRHPTISTNGEISAYRKGFNDGQEERAAEILLELEDVFGDDLKATSLWREVFGAIDAYKAAN